MNVTQRYLNRTLRHDTLFIYRLKGANKYIVVVANGYDDKKDKYIFGAWKNKRVRKALRITKKNWKRLTENKTAYDTKEEAIKFKERLLYHLANNMKEE